MTYGRICLAVFFLAVLLFISPRAHACSCSRITDPDAFVTGAGAIFEGALVEQVVVKAAPPGTSGFDLPKIVGTFKVFDAYKGLARSDRPHRLCRTETD